MSITWTPEEEDELLEFILPCESQTEMYLAFREFGKRRDRDARISIDEGEQWIRRRANRRTDYTGPANDKSRTRRDGLRITWMENQILIWAFSKKYTESKQEPTVEYIANLLQRMADEVKKLEHERTSTKFGIKGFV